MKRLPIKDSDALRQRCLHEIKRISAAELQRVSGIELSIKGFRSFLDGRNKSIRFDDGVRLVDYFNQKVIIAQLTDDEQEEYNSQLISTHYLMEKHPEINNKQAEQLLKFCKEHTIIYKTCYGDGNIMYPMWKEKVIIAQMTDDEQ